MRLTDDHSLVDELIREGRLTPEEAKEHPQRSIITRALGPEETVEVDTRSFRARSGDVYLLCSDGLTSMVGEARLAELLRKHAHARLRDTGEALIAEANRAGGRDNITVILLRLEEVEVSSLTPGATAEGRTDDQPQTDRHATLVGAPAVVAPAVVTPAADGDGWQTPTTQTVVARRPRDPTPARSTGAQGGRSPSHLRRALPAVVVLTVLGILAAGAYIASQSVYFLATNSRGLVTLYQGFPFQLPGGLKLYSSYYVSGVGASTPSPAPTAGTARTHASLRRRRRLACAQPRTGRAQRMRAARAQRRGGAPR